MLRTALLYGAAIRCYGRAMTERTTGSGEYQPSFPLGRGFSVLRLAVGRALEDLADNLDTLAERDPELEVRHPNPGPHSRRKLDRRPGVQLVSGRDIRNMRLPRYDFPLAGVYDELTRTVPSLDAPMTEVTLTEAYDVEIDRGNFIVIGVDDESSDKLKAERAGILRTAMGLGRMAARQRLYLPEPDMTIGFLGEDSAPRTIDAIYEIIDARLPMVIDLDAAIKHPHEV
jgi:hypothetical protein